MDEERKAQLVGGGLAAGGIVALIVKKTKSKPPKQTLGQIINEIPLD